MVLGLFERPPPFGTPLKDWPRDWFAFVISCVTIFGFTGGWVNAIAFLGVWKTGLSHLTGLTTNGAIRVINPAKPGQITEVMYITYITGFFVGGAVAGFVIGQPRTRWGRLQGLVLLINGTALFFAWLLADHQLVFSGWLVTFAMGGQNAITSLFAPMSFRNSHVSGHVLDMGIATGQTLRNLNLNNVWKIQANLPTYLGFWGGALCGTMAYNAMLMDSLLVAAVACWLVGTVTVAGCTLYNLYADSQIEVLGSKEIQMEPGPDRGSGSYSSIGHGDTDDDDEEDDEGGLGKQKKKL